MDKGAGWMVSWWDLVEEELGLNLKSHQTRRNSCDVVCYEDNQWQSMFDIEQEKAISIHLNKYLMICSRNRQPDPK